MEQDHVFAVLGLSALFFEALPYLSENKIPVVGAAFDATRVVEASSLQHVLGHRERGLHQGLHHDRSVPEEPGRHQPRCHRLLGLAESAAAAQQAAVSAQAQGIKTGYINDSFPFGSTNVHRSPWP